MLRRKFISLLMAPLIFGFSACGKENNDPTEIIITGRSSITVGEKITLKASPKPEDATLTNDIVWSIDSGSEHVYILSEKIGTSIVLTASSEGESVIKVVCGTLSNTFNITINASSWNR